MKKFRLFPFTFKMWIRFQIMSIIVWGIWWLLRNDTKLQEALLMIGISSILTAFFSALACISYAIMVFLWIKNTEIHTFLDLKRLLHHAGWINVFFFALVVIIYNAISYLSLEDLQEIGLMAFVPIVVGQIAIFWTIQQTATFEKEVSQKIKNLIEEIGKEEE